MAKVHLSKHLVHQVMDAAGYELVPWGVERIGAREIWPMEKGDNTVIAILDTGCDPKHPDLAQRIIDGRNFTGDYGGDPDNFRDNHYHGTHVAGTAAAALNASGVVGVAPACKLLIGKVMDGQGSGEIPGVAAAIRWATAWRGPQGERARVISMSLGGPVDDPGMHQAIKEAVAAGVLVVCSAGNDGPGNAEFPGSYPEVVEVGATDEQDHVANFSNTNPELDLVAPGVNITSTYPGANYAVLSGTSMAVPHVAAAAALIVRREEMAYRRTLSEPELFAQLIRRVRDLGLPKTVQGAGLLRLVEQPSAITGRVYHAQIVRQLRPRNGYAVQLGTYRSGSAARALVDNLKSDLRKAGASLVLSE